MGYQLFLDDERLPPNDGKQWMIARSYAEAVSLVETHGCPEVVSFDHDLGAVDGRVQKTGLDFAMYLVSRDLDADILPDDFFFTIHSQNPVGAENIKCYLRSYLRFKHDKEYHGRKFDKGISRA